MKNHPMRTRVLGIATALSLVFTAFALTIGLWPENDGSGYELVETIPS